MRHHVLVSFGNQREYAYAFAPEDLVENAQDEARRWFDREFSDLHCQPQGPMGKVLIIDKILAVARAAGEERFAAGDDWALQFARSAAQVLGRERVRIDLEALAISY